MQRQNLIVLLDSLRSSEIMASVVAVWVFSWQWYFCVALPMQSAAIITLLHPPFWYGSGFSLAPPSLKWLSSLAAGAKLEWHGERVQCDSVPFPH